MHILLCHSVLGMRDVEQEAVEILRAGGNFVSAPDMFGGARATSIDEGAEIVARLGWTSVCRRARSALENLDEHAVLAGFSMGVGVAAELWAERPKASGALFFHALPRLPKNMRPNFPFQVHVGQLDTTFASEQLVEQLGVSAQDAKAGAEVYRYPFAKHFFTDRESVDHDGDAAAICWQRSLEFLGRIAA
jgi:dienelactone hydrolase